jgi:predicted O-methyltransferase YrrM
MTTQNDWRMGEREGEQLYKLAYDLKPNVILETGTHQGYSGMWFLKALNDLNQGILITVDILTPGSYTKINANGLQKNHALATKNLSSVSDRFVQIVDTIPDVETIDLLFINGDHSLAGCLHDLKTYYPKLRKGGLCLMHDFHGIQVPAAFDMYFSGIKDYPKTELRSNDVFKNDLLVIYK